ncbi:MAG: NAD(P)/FAD-dependent oxidoreductase [Gemmatales bacterium]
MAENTYPGIACDVSAHWYTYSFARNPEWDRLMAPGAKIQAYFEKVFADHDLAAVTRFGDEVTALTYDDAGQWDLATASGHKDRFDVVVVATGFLHHPNVPEFEGLETFEGAVFHSARWDHDVAVDGKKVGVVGTGSTAAQLTVALVERASQFRLFQRTAQWVMHRPNPAYTEEEKALFRSDPAALAALIETLKARTLDGYSTAVLDVDSPEYAKMEQLCQENLAYRPRP